VFSGGFRRSGLFGLFGVIAVAAIVVMIALTTGEGQSNPKTTYALIFGVVGLFMVILFALQRSTWSVSPPGTCAAPNGPSSKAGGRSRTR
jgi:hypothetical protein